MTQILEWIMGFFREFKFLVTVPPWERGLRVRLGNRVQLWEPGVHLRLPFVDAVSITNSRLRISDSDSQTLTTSDGHAFVVAMSVGFRIDDPLVASMRMHNPEGTIRALTGSVVASIVSTSTREALTVALIEQHVLQALEKESAGYAFEFVRVVDFAYAPVFRVLQHSSYRCGLAIEDRKT